MRDLKHTKTVIQNYPPSVLLTRPHLSQLKSLNIRRSAKYVWFRNNKWRILRLQSHERAGRARWWRNACAAFLFSLHSSPGQLLNSHFFSTVPDGTLQLQSHKTFQSTILDCKKMTCWFWEFWLVSKMFGQEPSCVLVDSGSTASVRMQLPVLLSLVSHLACSEQK